MAALQQQTAQWQIPPGDGACALHSQPAGQLDCDSEALREIILAQTATLAGMLEAWLSINPSTEALAIVYAQGRYQVTLDMASPGTVTPTKAPPRARHGVGVHSTESARSETVDPGAGAARPVLSLSKGRDDNLHQRTGASVTSMPRDVTVTAPGL